MKNVPLGFQGKTLTVPIDHILPTRVLSKDVRRSRKFQTILASVREVGVIEPLAVHPEVMNGGANGHYILLDGHLRLEALKALGAAEAVCLISIDDEGYTYNRRINRLSAVQEHKMILKAIERRLSPERIAQSLDVNVERIRARQHLLDGIAPEVVDLLKDRMVSQGVFATLRKMKPMRQIETAEMMISANRFTINYAQMVLAASRPDLLVDSRKPKPAEATPEDIARMEREMEKLQQDHKLAEDTLGETMLVLVIAKGYLARLMRNEAVAKYLTRHHQDLASELGAVMEAIGTDARSLERE
jgi:RepB plasmid partitioning protein/ParB-like nuclease domain